jgi:hypothetical protein
MEPTTEGRGASTSMLYKLLYTQSLLKLKSYRILILTFKKNKMSLQELLQERLGHLQLSPEEYNSMACDLANDHAQAMLECGPEDYPDYDEEPDTSGPVHSTQDGVCYYCGSDKEPNVDYEIEMQDYVFAGTYSDCECRSIVNECRDTLYDDDWDTDEDDSNFGYSTWEDGCD